MDIRVVDNAAGRKFELMLSDDAVASAYYSLNAEGHVALIHTDIPPEFARRNVGIELATGTFDLLRRSGRKAILKCRFMATFYAGHPEYADVVAE